MDAPIVFRLRPREKALLVAHLARLCEHGSDPSELWRTAQLGMLSGTFRKHAERIALALSNGMTLSDALSRYPRSFSAFEVAIVRAGERAHRAHDALLAWHAHLVRAATVRTSASRSIAYSVAVALVAAVSLFPLYATTKFTMAPLYVESGHPFPLLARFMTGNGAFVLAAVPLLLLGLGAWWHRRLLRSDGRLLALELLAAASRSGLPIQDALALAADVQRLRSDRRELQELSRRLGTGEPISVARGACFDASTTLLLDAALRSADPVAVQRVADHARFAAERAQRRSVELVHDALLIGLGLFVGLIVIGFAPAYFSPVAGVP